MNRNEMNNVLPEPFFEESRKLWRLDYRRKVFRSDRKGRDGKPLTDRQMKQNVLDKVRAYYWSITGDPNVGVRDQVKEWCAYLGYTVTPFEGPQKQKWERYEQIPGQTPLVGEYTFDQYYRNFKNHILPEIGTIAVGRVTREDLKTIIDKSIACKKYNSDTVVHFRKPEHLFFEWQRIECKSIKENPVHDITIKKQKLN